MTDRELLELLLSKFASMEAKIDGMDSRIDRMENDIKNIRTELKSVSEQTAILTEFREETITRLDNIENKLDDLEVKNATRHIEIEGRLNKISRKVTKLEIVTADNWGDIAIIKADRNYKAR